MLPRDRRGRVGGIATRRNAPRRWRPRRRARAARRDRGALPVGREGTVRTVGTHLGSLPLRDRRGRAVEAPAARWGAACFALVAIGSFLVPPRSAATSVGSASTSRVRFSRARCSPAGGSRSPSSRSRCSSGSGSPRSTASRSRAPIRRPARRTTSRSSPISASAQVADDDRPGRDPVDVPALGSGLRRAARAPRARLGTSTRHRVQPDLLQGAAHRRHVSHVVARQRGPVRRTARRAARRLVARRTGA